MKAIRFHQQGGPEVLVLEDIPEPSSKPDHVVIRVRAAGMNFADTRFIRGQYFVRPVLPDIPGMEVAGDVVEIGEGVTDFAVGDRVVALGARAFAEKMVARQRHVYPIPAGLDYERAAALPIQGLTAHHVLFLVGRLGRGERVLIHAAAGGVGTLAIQLAKQRGAVVVASCSADKHELATSLGADFTIDSRGDVLRDLKKVVPDVDLVLEMIGGTDSYKRNLAALAPLGRMVVFGAASGDTRGQLEPVGLMHKNLTASGYYLTPLLDRRELCAPPFAEMADAVAAGTLRVEIGARYTFADAVKGFRDLEDRSSRGKVVLLP